MTFVKDIPSIFGTDLDEESSPGHTNDFKNYTYCSSACAGHNGLEYGEYLSHKKGAAHHTLYNGPQDKGGIIKRARWLFDKIKGYKTYGPL